LKQIGDEQAMTAVSKREAENSAEELDEYDDNVEEPYEGGYVLRCYRR
jgi:hypothetical protein